MMMMMVERGVGRGCQSVGRLIVILSLVGCGRETGQWQLTDLLLALPAGHGRGELLLLRLLLHLGRLFWGSWGVRLLMMMTTMVVVVMSGWRGRRGARIMEALRRPIDADSQHTPQGGQQGSTRVRPCIISLESSKATGSKHCARAHTHTTGTHHGSSSWWLLSFSRRAASLFVVLRCRGCESVNQFDRFD